MGVALLAYAFLETAIFELPLVSLVSVGLCAVALTLRRRFPLVAAAVVAAAPLVDQMFGGPWVGPQAELIAAVVAAYSVAAFATGFRALAGGALVLAGLWLRVAWTAFGPGVEAPLQFAFYFVFVAMPWIAGRASREERQRTETLKLLTTRLRRERDAVGRLAAAGERARIAQDLHRLVTGSVVRMRGLTEAADDGLRDGSGSPDETRRLLGAVQEIGRAAIADLGRMLRVLRVQGRAADDPDDAPDPARDAPVPAIDAQTWRPPLHWSTLGDALLAAGTVGLYVVELWSSRVYEVARGPVASALLLAIGLAVFFRRRYPVAAVLVATAALEARHVIAGPGPPEPVAGALTSFATVYAAAVFAPMRRSLPACAAAVVAGWIGGEITGIATVSFALYLMLAASVPYLAGRAVRGYALQAAELECVTERLRREADARARLAVVEERTGMARELHDTVAHAVSVMVIQAGAAIALLDSDPERSRGAIATALRTGREAQTDLDRLLATLPAGDEPGTGPRPSLARLDELVSEGRRAGLAIAVHVEGRPVPMPPGTDGSAFRIIQESLTNALKHAGPVPTDVTVRYCADGLDLEIINAHGDVHSPRLPGGTRQGLCGMRERVELLHGQLDVGPDATGGFHVRAHLPVLSEP
jgi:signal transduction histidine kinase